MTAPEILAALAEREIYLNFRTGVFSQGLEKSLSIDEVCDLLPNATRDEILSSAKWKPVRSPAGVALLDPETMEFVRWSAQPFSTDSPEDIARVRAIVAEHKAQRLAGLERLVAIILPVRSDGQPDVY